MTADDVAAGPMTGTGGTGMSVIEWTTESGGHVRLNIQMYDHGEAQFDLETTRGEVSSFTAANVTRDAAIEIAVRLRALFPTDEKTDWHPHPDYGSGSPGNPNGDLCTCGGIRRWHATKVGGGCEDCPCPEFEFA